MRRSPQRPKRRIQKPRDCAFCKGKKEPDYKDPDSLKQFITERGKIMGRMYSGLCQKHQGKLARAIKRARFIALLPFIVRPTS